jgi:hypothetical protein
MGTEFATAKEKKQQESSEARLKKKVIGGSKKQFIAPLERKLWAWRYQLSWQRSPNL